jgi:hypothetical protein
MKSKKWRVFNSSLIFFAALLPVLVVLESPVTKFTLIWVWDAPSAFWEVWVLAGIGAIAVVVELFVPERFSAIKSSIALGLSLFAIVMLYFLYEGSNAFANDMVAELNKEAFFSALLSKTDPTAVLNSLQGVKVPYTNVSITVLAFAVVSYGIDALSSFIREAGKALRQA